VQLFGATLGTVLGVHVLQEGVVQLCTPRNPARAWHGPAIVRIDLW
jgi:hypothetical protein